MTIRITTIVVIFLPGAFSYHAGIRAVFAVNFLIVAGEADSLSAESYVILEGGQTVKLLYKEL